MRTVEKWRYRCPRGHTGWECTGKQFWCSQCHVGTQDAAFDSLHDRKTGERVDASEWLERIE